MAALAAWPVSKAAGDFMVRIMFKSGLDFSFQLMGIVIWLGISIVLGAIASALPAWQVSRRPIREAMSYE